MQTKKAANERIDALLKCNLVLYQQTEKAKDKKKLFNVIIRGVPEKAMKNYMKR